MKINVTHWPFFRLLRIAVAIGCFYAYFINSSEWFILVIGIISLLQAVLNTGCNDGSCEIPEDKK
jgi:F0F1-type ATP synthase assembly protein I